MFRFDNTYAHLPESFYSQLQPTPVRSPRLLHLNEPLVHQLGLDLEELSERKAAAIFSGNELPTGAIPLAMAYAGHQFGGWVPQLGDGRAILLGEVITPEGSRRDIQLKGAGPTPFSRSGDGRSALGPVLREYVVSEAMAALGIPTTRALAVVTTGEPVFRETALPGAVLTRVAASHIRIGTFQFFAARGDGEALRSLADYAITRHDPQAVQAPNPYRALLDGVVKRQAALVARWMSVGFIHGVMNTDNMTISGETIDYGPCAFMDTFHPNQVYSSIDRLGRYAFANQPHIAHWNLTRLAETLLPLLGKNEKEALAEAQAAIDKFPDTYQQKWLSIMRSKLGLFDEHEEDETLCNDLLDRMADGEADFTLTFRRLAETPSVAQEPQDDTPLRALFSEQAGIDRWLERWRARLTRQSQSDLERRQAQRTINPAFIPRNHRLAEAIRAAEDRGDLGLFEELVETLARPFEDQPEHAHLMTPPKPEQIVHRTFCGT